ncbi:MULTISPECIES: VOC family protein [unclassified Mesorhizobium]|uniref:VOC family protein n=1 Tax=unclassified Mesorhizobium TaxID=325217 RepID=UPI000FE9B31F|nr:MULTISPECIES: VOC family protein [unclassified Mesorhizobium]RWC73447.1 MAG: glyoxalase [Mesorhizobium sp.]RWC90541.1 MAG: glyoxalase [Mesorhizobium sp.]TGQ78657.1 glyoxalase [Mesorhizobium sp. M8A.F.Ca.ET.207.01.1.1]TGT86346.1 glyoxalase [Mesorhizobium sp. M8A.F.Ca.ET.161.01.1.1]TGV40737.1 glyoxalase [Mesorhizobium sp. M8A.F.Ca.ET.142.01.1.1]
MTIEDPFKHPVLGSGVFYRDPRAALDWLEEAFGFEPSMVVRDTGGKLIHAEMRFGDGCIIVDSEWADHVASPASVGGKNTQSVYIRLKDGLDAHCEQARAAGAAIIQEPADQFYGERQYRARDPEGHIWTFTQPIRSVSREEAERLGGLRIEGWHR